MSAWITLAAAVVGATIALVGQQVTRRSEARRRGGELLLEQCALVVALAHDYTNRLWEEKELGLVGRVDGWDLQADRLAVARLRILSADNRLRQALEELEDAGEELGKYWRGGSSDSGEFDARKLRFKTARAAFEAASASVVKHSLGSH
ncbi:hypothetical protein [Catenulispora rubra]|uniref:hypothetical protein n=1 Tax=Catenulispora rubra TaxID=280293 RepID=UPI0018927196|nr:hypothetical protein [Catenulispora rubra]